MGARDAGGDLDLVEVVDEHEAVLHAIDGDGLGRHLVVHGVTLVAVDQHLHGAVERGGEQERLVLAVGVPEDPLDLGQEPHVGHAVGLVEHDVVDRVEHERLAVEEVDHPARGGDDDLGAGLQLTGLLVEGAPP